MVRFKTHFAEARWDYMRGTWRDRSGQLTFQAKVMASETYEDMLVNLATATVP